MGMMIEDDLLDIGAGGRASYSTGENLHNIPLERTSNADFEEGNVDGTFSGMSLEVPPLFWLFQSVILGLT